MNLNRALALSLMFLSCGPAQPTNLSGSWLGSMTVTGTPEFQGTVLSKTLDGGLSVDDSGASNPNASATTNVRDVTFIGCSLSSQTRASPTVISLSSSCPTPTAFDAFCSRSANSVNVGSGTIEFAGPKATVALTGSIACAGIPETFVTVTVTGTFEK